MCSKWITLLKHTVTSMRYRAIFTKYNSLRVIKFLKSFDGLKRVLNGWNYWLSKKARTVSVPWYQTLFKPSKQTIKAFWMGPIRITCTSMSSEKTTFKNDMKTPIKLCAHRKTANSKKGHLIKTKNQRAMAHISGLNLPLSKLSICRQISSLLLLQNKKHSPRFLISHTFKIKLTNDSLFAEIHQPVHLYWAAKNPFMCFNIYTVWSMFSSLFLTACLAVLCSLFFVQ